MRTIGRRRCSTGLISAASRCRPPVTRSGSAANRSDAAIWRLCIGAGRAYLGAMAEPAETTSQSVDPPRNWTRLDDYLDLARLWGRSGERHRRRFKPRTEPSAPRLLSLGMLPFVLLM